MVSFRVSLTELEVRRGRAHLFHGAAFNQALLESLGHLGHGVDVDEFGLAAELEALHQVRHLLLVAARRGRLLALACQLGLQVLVKRGREYEGLPLRRLVLVILMLRVLIGATTLGILPVESPDDVLRLLELANLEESIRLVDDEKVNMRESILEFDVAVHDLPQSARRADDNVCLFKLALLLLDAEATGDDADVWR